MSECDESIIYQMGYNKGFGDGIKGSVPKSVLEDIKAEIYELYPTSYYSDEHGYKLLRESDILNILDNHISGKEQQGEQE